jgi:hypothetical protein
MLKRISLYSLIMASVFVLSGCGTSAKPQAETSPTAPTAQKPAVANTVVNVTAQPQVPTEAKVNNSGNCANKYYPVSVNSTWTYTGTNSVSGSFSFTRAITNVRADGFDDSDTWDSGIKRTGSWTCSQGNLTALNEGGVATVSMPAGDSAPKLEAESVKSDGVSIPAELTVNKNWTQTINLSGKMTMPQGVAAVNVTNVTGINCTPSGEEDITVPAGNFKAMKVVCPSSITIVIEGNPATSITSTSTVWYAAGTGIVKITDENQMGNTTIELSKYNLAGN